MYNEPLLVHPHHSLRFALGCFLQGNGQDRATFLFRERGLRAVIQARGRHGRPEQDILYLAAYGTRKEPLPSDHDIWYRLVERAIINAGHHQVQRLYASVWSQRVEVQEILRQLGFQAFMKRIVLQLSGPDWDQGTRMAPMRSQSRQDAWAIHRLYGTVTPHLVQRAEARVPRNWTPPLSHRWQALQRRGWVLGSNDELLAYLHLTSGPGGHVFTLLLHPTANENAANILRFGLAQLRDDTKTVYLIIPEYHSDLLKPAQNLGFQPVNGQTVLVKHTTIAARRPVLLSAFEPTLEPRIPVPRISVPREDL